MNDTKRTYPALNLMERQLPPLRHGRQPYWRAPVVKPSAEVYVPAWNWYTVHDVTEGTPLVTLDANGAYLGALGNVTIAHSQLERMGPWDNLPTPKNTPPGYYKITIPYWSFSGSCVHPLGDSAVLQELDVVWVAAPTLILLLELLDTGHLGPFSILDSYTSAVPTSFTAWADRLKSLRREIMDKRDQAHRGQTRPDKCQCPACAEYDGFKTGYSLALSMMLTGERCGTHRPDWAHTVYAEHAATQWRKAWRYTYTGYNLISMGAVDEITVRAEDLHAVLSRPRPPFRFDASGRSIGAFKPKRNWTWTDDQPPAPTTAAVLAHLDDGDDIL
jgi:hypothetical protein